MMEDVMRMTCVENTASYRHEDGVVALDRKGVLLSQVCIFLFRKSGKENYHR